MTNESDQLKVLLSMPAAERKVLFLQGKVDFEQSWLAEMLDDWKYDRSVSMTQIREQRKAVQVWSKRLNEAKKMLSKSEPSDKQSHS